MTFSARTSTRFTTFCKPLLFILPKDKYRVCWIKKIVVKIKQRVMRSSVKVLVRSAEPRICYFRYRELFLSECVESAIGPPRDEMVCLEIVPAENSVFGTSYYTKVDVYSYIQDGGVFFSLIQLPLWGENVVVSESFFAKLRAFLGVYLEEEIARLNMRCFDSGKRCFCLAQFYFKHNLHKKAAFFSKKAQREDILESWEMAVLCENKVCSRILVGKSPPRKSAILRTVRLYGADMQNVSRFVVDVGGILCKMDLVFLMNFLEPKNIKYMPRIYFFFRIAQLFGQKEANCLAIVSYVYAYFSAKDGYNTSFKIYLRNMALMQSKKSWKEVITNILDKVSRNESEEMQILVRKSDMAAFYMPRKVLIVEDSEYFDLKISSMDNIVLFGSKGVLYARKNHLERDIIHHLGYVRMEIFCKTHGMELLEIGLRGEMLEESPGDGDGGAQSIILMKKLDVGKNVINIYCGINVELTGLRFRRDGMNFLAKVKKRTLVRIAATFTYSVQRLFFDALGNFHMCMAVSTSSDRAPRVFCPGNEASVTFDKDNGISNVTISKKCLQLGEIRTMCEVADGTYKEYFLHHIKDNHFSLG